MMGFGVDRCRVWEMKKKRPKIWPLFPDHVVSLKHGGTHLIAVWCADGGFWNELR